MLRIFLVSEEKKLAKKLKEIKKWFNSGLFLAS
jgi:hypothetical protein